MALTYCRTLTTSQRTLLELLADEFKDNTAKRVMNLNKYKEEGNHSQSATESSSTDEHDHDGFLKRIWDKLTHGKGNGKEGGSSESENKKP